MATIDFPNSPAVNDVFTAGNSSYKWTGTAWVSNNLGQIDATEVVGLADYVRTLPTQISSKTANYTLVAGDTNDLIQANGTFTITVPASTIPAGTRVDVVNTGTGVITFAGSGGLTIQSKYGFLTIPTQYAAATLFFTSTTTALLIGDIA
jgi:hypothetical protein